MSELIPEYYSDVFYLRSGPWGVATSYSVAAPKEGIATHDVCVVRLSHETAKALSMMIRKQLKTYERDSKTSIAIPQDIMNSLGLAPEDW